MLPSKVLLIGTSKRSALQVSLQTGAFCSDSCSKQARCYAQEFMTSAHMGWDKHYQPTVGPVWERPGPGGLGKWNSCKSGRRAACARSSSASHCDFQRI